MGSWRVCGGSSLKQSTPEHAQTTTKVRLGEESGRLCWTANEKCSDVGSRAWLFLSK